MLKIYEKAKKIETICFYPIPFCDRLEVSCNPLRRSQTAGWLSFLQQIYTLLHVRHSEPLLEVAESWKIQYEQGFVEIEFWDLKRLNVSVTASNSDQTIQKWKKSEGTLPLWLSRLPSGSPSLCCHWTECFHSGPTRVCLCRSSSQSERSRGIKKTAIDIQSSGFMAQFML